MTPRDRCRAAGALGAVALALMVGSSGVLLAGAGTARASREVSGPSASEARAGFGVVATVAAPGPTRTPVYDPGTGDLYVPTGGASAGSTGTLLVISALTNQLVGQIGLGDEIGIPTLDAANGDLYVPEAGNLAVVSPALGTELTPLLNGTSVPGEPVYDPLNGNLFVPFENNLTVVAPATGKVVASIGLSVGDTPTFVPSSGDLYVPLNDQPTLAVVSGASYQILGNVSVGFTPTTPLFDPVNDELYVADAGSSEVSVVSPITDQLVTTISVGGEPGTPGLDPINDLLYVPNSGSDTVSIISGTSNEVTATVPVGRSPVSPTWDSIDQDLYVANAFSANLTVISGDSGSTLADIPVVASGEGPISAPAVDPEGEVFAPGGFNSWTVVVIAGGGPYLVEFNETGLPSSATWSVTLNGVGASSATNVALFASTNGTASFTVAPVPGYSASPGSGNVSVVDADVQVHLSFNPNATPPALTTLYRSPWFPALVAVLAVAAVSVAILVARRKARARRHAEDLREYH